MSPKIRKAYQILFDELSKPRYATWTLYDYFVKERKSRSKVNVTLRIDVDSTLNRSMELGHILKKSQITSTFFFLTFPKRYYDIWNSKIPKGLAEMGFEIGLHSDHYYEEILTKRNALELIRNDVRKLSKITGSKIYGMVAHGHEKMGAGENATVYWNINPRALSLLYHDGRFSAYSKKNFSLWEPPTDHYISDYMGMVGVWNYCQNFAVKKLRKVKVGESIHIIIHPINVFSSGREVKNLREEIKAVYLCYIKENIATTLIKLFGREKVYRFSVDIREFIFHGA